MELNGYFDIDTLHDKLMGNMGEILGLGISYGQTADIISAIESRLEEIIELHKLT